MQITDAIEEYLYARRKLAPKTKSWYGDKLHTFAKWCDSQGITDIERVDVHTIRKYQDYRATIINPRTGQPLSSYSLHSDAAVIKTFLTYCHHDEILPTNPGKRIEAPTIVQKMIEIFSPEQVITMLAVTTKAHTPMLASRDRAIVAVLIDTGIRASELCSLKIGDVWLGRDECFLVVMGKGRKQREVGLGLEAGHALRRYMFRYRKTAKPEQHVFLNRVGKPLTRKGLDQMLERLGRLAHITGVRVSAHTFRHTYAVSYIRNGGEISKLSRLLGHTSIAVTSDVYLRAFQSRDARKNGLSVLDTLKPS